jgi:nicotinate phosphoribosyltransferase
VGKITGDAAAAEAVKKELGYVERHWKGGDETSRWSSNAADMYDDDDNDDSDED